jgi:GNAT superfamily N-acetyltransferase
MAWRCHYDVMDNTKVDPDDTTLAKELFALQQAVHAAERPDDPPPLWEPFLARLRQTDPEVRIEWLAARVGDQLVGRATIGLPVVDNRHIAQVYVSPAHRRRGVGRALLEQVCQLAQDDHRRTLVGGASRPVPGGPPRPDAGARFLAALGFTPALEGLLRRIDMAAVDPASEQRLLAECLPHATDYGVADLARSVPGPARRRRRRTGEPAQHGRADGRARHR